MKLNRLKKFYFVLLLFSFFACNSSQRPDINKYCPYAIGDHLEYRNQWTIHYADETQEESKVFIIYEVIGLSKSTEGSIVRLKRYYTDIHGTVEDSIKNVYTDERVIMVRPDKSKDSLVFKLGDNRLQTLEDYTDEDGFRKVTKVVENNASVTSSKGILFEGCLKIETAISKPGEKKALYEKISYYKDSILVKYSSTDQRATNENIVKLDANSELNSYHIYAWQQ